MEITSSVWVISLIALTAGALIGALAYRLFAPSVKQAERARTELQAARDELGSYRDSVNDHFDKTAELVNDLTQNYVRVYQHLAEGAQTLGDGKRFDNLLEQQSGKVAIAVDEDRIAPAASAGASVVDAGVPPVDGPADGDEPLAAKLATTATAEVAESSAATGDQPGAARPEIAGAASGAHAAGGSEPDRDARRPAESADPVVNVDALDQAIGKADRDRDDDAAGAVPESKRETEVRTTTH